MLWASYSEIFNLDLLFFKLPFQVLCNNPQMKALSVYMKEFC